MLKTLIALTFALTAALTMSTSVRSQCPAVMPAGTVCISQATANQASADHRELDATKAKVATLEDALKLKDVTIAENKATALQNEADLTNRLHRTEVELATATGELIATRAGLVTANARIDQLTQMVRPKKIGLINF